MRYLFTSIIFAFYVSLPCHAQIKSDLVQEHIIGRVKTIVDSQFITVPDSVQITIRQFDESGNIVMEDYYQASFHKAHTTVTYDERGIKKARLLHDFFFDEDDNYTYTLDKTKKELIEYRYMDGILNSTVTYPYDEKGNIISYTVTQPDGVVRGTITYLYDGHDNKIAQIDAYSKCTYTYDNVGNLLESKMDGLSPVKYQFSKFDKAGNWQQKDDFDGTFHSKTIRRIVYW